MTTTYRCPACGVPMRTRPDGLLECSGKHKALTPPGELCRVYVPGRHGRLKPVSFGARPVARQRKLDMMR